MSETGFPWAQRRYVTSLSLVKFTIILEANIAISFWRRAKATRSQTFMVDDHISLSLTTRHSCLLTDLTTPQVSETRLMILWSLIIASLIPKYSGITMVHKLCTVPFHGICLVLWERSGMRSSFFATTTGDQLLANGKSSTPTTTHLK